MKDRRLLPAGLPSGPGVYIMKDRGGRIIYIGKAASLKKRVGAYFRESNDPKVNALREKISDVEFIATGTEQEALLLESSLINMHKPKYNVRLKDDKKWLYIKVTKEEFPRIFLTRDVLKDGARYYGPFCDAGATRRSVKALRRLFPICSCKTPGRTGERPCLDYQMKLCTAPFAGKISKEEYAEIVDDLDLFLKGRHKELLLTLEKDMVQASEHLEFERAAIIRDRIKAIKKTISGQKIVIPRKFDEDVIGLYKKGSQACVQVFFVREGKIIDRVEFFLDARLSDESEILASFLKQYYSKNPAPKEILLPFEFDEMDSIGTWLMSKSGVRLAVPKRGKKHDLLIMAKTNAMLSMERKGEDVGILNMLQDDLGLETVPRVIEAFDISNIMGKRAVGSMVVFRDGRPSRKDYRRFKIKTVAGQDDVAMLKEVVRRRYRRVIDEAKPLPDLILIDGGRGQLNGALQVLGELGIGGIPAVGLAKREEEIYQAGRPDPLVLQRDSRSLRLLQQVRDEAHRFAVAYHRTLRSRGLKLSVLDDIPGIGRVRKKKLLTHFGSMNDIKKASLEELEGVVGRKLAERIYSSLHEAS